MRWRLRLLWRAAALVPAASALLLAPTAVVASVAYSDTGLTIAPYFWGPSIEGRVGIDGTSVPVDLGVEDLAGGINAAGMGYLMWSGERHFFYLEGLGMRFRQLPSSIRAFAVSCSSSKPVMASTLALMCLTVAMRSC